LLTHLTEHTIAGVMK